MNWTDDDKVRIAYRDLPDQWKKVSSYRALIHIALIWTAIGLAAYVHSLYPSVFVYIAVILFIGGLQNNLNSLVHHSIHGNIHPDKKMNSLFTRLFLSGPLGHMFEHLKAEHLSHHAIFGDDDDPERFYYDLSYHRRHSRFGLLRWVICVFFGWVFYPMLLRMLTGDRSGAKKHADKPSVKKVDKNATYFDLLSIVLCQSVLFFGFYVLTANIWGYVLYWILPLSTFGAAFTALRATLEHANPDDPDHLFITFKSNAVESFFIGPLNFNYHYEHHRFMNIPYYHVSKVHKFLREKHDHKALLVGSYFGRLLHLLKSLPAVPRKKNS